MTNQTKINAERIDKIEELIEGEVTEQIQSYSIKPEDIEPVVRSLMSDYVTLTTEQTLKGKTINLEDNNIIGLQSVAYSGSYLSLTDKPTIPSTVAELSDANNYALKSSLKSVATTGSYNDLTDKPTIPSDIVDKTTNQTISGTKTFNNTTIFSNQTSLATTISAPAADKTTYTDIQFRAGSNRMNTVRGSQIADSEGNIIRTEILLGCNGPDSAAPSGITVKRTTDSITTYAQTPTETTGTDGTQIATTGWVNKTGNNVVHLSGSETISGTKTFSALNATTIKSAVYQQTINALGNSSGTVTLESNKVYTMTATGNVTFSLPSSPTTSITNTIKVLYYQAAARTISWGTTYFYNGKTPDMSSAGYYDIYFDYHPILKKWVCGAMIQKTA